MNTSRKGNSAEVYVARWLQDRGWLVASRRHIGGAADLLAIHPKPRVSVEAVAAGITLPFATNVLLSPTWLIEVKDCKELWQQFRREDRQAMRDTPLPPGGERFVVNKRGKDLIWIAESDWP